MRRSLLLVAAFACALQLALAAEVATMTLEQEEAAFEAELGAATTMATEAMFESEASMHLAFATPVSAAPAALDLDAPQDSTADVKKAVWTFCKNPAANLIAPASASKSQPLTGVSAYVSKGVQDAMWGCVASLARAFDKGPVAITKAGINGCLATMSSAEILLRVKVASEDPLNPDAETYKKLVKFFEEHPLVQYAFTEALSVSVDLALSNGDFVSVALKHSQGWATVTFKTYLAPAWEALTGGLRALAATWSATQAADALRQARKQIYDFLYANSPPSVRAAIGSLQDARAMDERANQIKEELFATAPGQAFVKTRAKFRATAMNTVIGMTQFAMGLATTVAAAPTGLGAAMAGLATAIALRKVAFNTRDTAQLYCQMNAEWQACLDSVTGKRFQEAEAEAVKKWKEARQTAVAIFTGPAAAAAPATPQAMSPTGLGIGPSAAGARPASATSLGIGPSAIGPLPASATSLGIGPSSIGPLPGKPARGTR